MFDFVRKIIGVDKSEKNNQGTEKNPTLKISEGDRFLIKTEAISASESWDGIVLKTMKPYFKVRIFPIFPSDQKPDFNYEKTAHIMMSKYDKIVKFSTPVRNFDKQGTACTLDLEYPQDVKWSAIKIRIHTRTKMRINSKLKPEILKNAPWDMVKLVNLSAGGGGFLTSRPYKKDERIVIDFMYPYLPEGILGVIRRVESASDEADPKLKYFLGIEFQAMTIKEIEQIAKTCVMLRREGT
jgi:hypothetical protein